MRFFVISFWDLKLCQFVVELQRQIEEEVALTDWLDSLETDRTRVAELHLLVQLILLLLLGVLGVPGVEEDAHDCGHSQQSQYDEDDDLNGYPLANLGRGWCWWRGDGDQSVRGDFTVSDIPNSDNVQTVRLESELDVVVGGDEVTQDIKVRLGSPPLYQVLARPSLSAPAKLHLTQTCLTKLGEADQPRCQPRILHRALGGLGSLLLPGRSQHLHLAAVGAVRVDDNGVLHPGLGECEHHQPGQLGRHGSFQRGGGGHRLADLVPLSRLVLAHHQVHRGGGGGGGGEGGLHVVR